MKINLKKLGIFLLIFFILVIVSGLIEGLFNFDITWGIIGFLLAIHLEITEDNSWHIDRI